MNVSAAVLLLVAMSAPAAQDWQPVPSSGPVTLKVRGRAGSDIQEISAVAELDAPASEVQAALTDNERLPKFMPHVKESRPVLKPHGDGGSYLYVLLQLPIIGRRDYVVKTYVDSRLKPDGSGEFKSHWKAEPDALPVRHNIPRIRVNDGSWKVTSVGPGRSRVEYTAFIDPGGIPAPSVNSGNRTEIPLTFKAVEAEARRRAKGPGERFDGGSPGL